MPKLVFLLTCEVTVAKDWVLLPAAGAAIAGYLYTSAVNLHTQRKDEAFQFLTRVDHSESFLRAIGNVNRFFESNEALSQEQIIEIVTPGGSEKFRTIQDDIRRVANFYEEMAIAIKYGHVQEELLEEFYSGLLIKFYESFKNFLPELRKLKKREDLYCNVVALHSHWLPKYEKLFCEPPE
jgi:hypothetical protein